MFVDVLSHKPSSRRRTIQAAYRQMVRDTWRRWRPAVFAVLAAVVIVFGYFGFHRAFPRESALDSLFRAVQLFTFGGNAPVHPNFLLGVARLLGPFVVGYAAVQGVFALYRQQLERLRLRWTRDHVVIVGLGAAGFRMARAFCEEDWRVVVIERDATNVAIAGCRERGIPVVSGDGTDPRILGAAGVSRAILLVALCGDDGTNVDVAAAARPLAAGRTRGVLTVLTGVDDVELWRVMRAQALMDRDDTAFRLELFNIGATAAEMLLSEHPPCGSLRDGSREHVLMVGAAGFAPSVIEGVIRRWYRSGAAGSLVITIADPGAESARTQLLNDFPELRSLARCELRTWEVDLTARAQLGAVPHDVSIVYVSLPSETSALTVALALRSQPALWHVPIVLAVADQRAGVGATVSRDSTVFRDVQAFGVLREPLTPQALLHTTTEQIARLTHDLHREQLLEVGIRDGEPALASWEELESSLRESNRLFADGIAANLERVGCMVIGAPLIADETPRFTFTDDEVERLAPLEHERWERAMKRIGYRHGPVKDHKRKRHPMIGLPWADLPEDNRDKDRAHVRSIPTTLAQVGLTIRRISEMDPGMDAAAIEGRPSAAPQTSAAPQPSGADAQRTAPGDSPDPALRSDAPIAPPL